MSYRVLLTAAAQKELARMPKEVAKRISAAIDKLADNPRPSGCKKLAGKDQTYRIRVGDYRVVFEINDKRVTVWVIRIRNRKDAYQ